MISILNSPSIKQYSVVFTANLNILCTGIWLAWPSPVLVKLRDPDEDVLGRPITELEGSWIASIGFLVGIFANLLPALLVDRIGRKRCILLAAAPKLISGLLFIFASDLWMILLGRAIGGFTDLINFNVIPIYASEIADTKIRGALGSILQIMSSLGFVFMLSVGPFVSYLTLNIIITVIVFVAFLPLLFLPESPYYLYTKGKEAKAIEVLTYLRGSEAAANAEIKEYAMSKSEGTKVKRLDLFKNRTFLKTLFIGSTLTVGAVLVGMNAVSYYLQTILESTDTSVRSEIASVIIGVIQLIASICSTVLTDLSGRKPILIVTLIGMTLGMAGLGTFFWIADSTDEITGFLNFLPLISIIFAVFSFSAGLGSINWALTAELFDGPSKALGMPIITCLSVTFNFLLTKFFQPVTVAIGAAPTYWLFMANCIIMGVFIITCVPETKGKTFAQIQAELGGKPVADEESVEPKSR